MLNKLSNVVLSMTSSLLTVSNKKATLSKRDGSSVRTTGRSVP